MSERYLQQKILNNLNELRQMAFLTGPRQVGKTTLARPFLRSVIPGVNYLNWDVAVHRKWLTTQLFAGKQRLDNAEQSIVVFDEIHKYLRWKNALKGLFDTSEPNTHWITTGSAMLNVYRRGQDSLLGRHFTYHLAPFSVAELAMGNRSVPVLAGLMKMSFGPPASESTDALATLTNYGGFPEPLFRTDQSFLVRWRRSRLDRLINQDLATTEMLRQLPLVEQLMFLLPERVGSPLSLNSLREDLEVHFATVRHWMELLERVYYGFYLRPYSQRRGRLLKKEAKWYLWDWTEIDDHAIRFENLMAVHLRKYVDYINDLGIGELSLHYVRDKEKREVDFLLCERHNPRLLIECKYADRTVSPHLHHFARLLGIPLALQVVGSGNVVPRTYQEDRVAVQILPAAALLQALV